MKGGRSTSGVTCRSLAILAAMLATLFGALTPYAARAAAPYLADALASAPAHHSAEGNSSEHDAPDHDMTVRCAACLLPPGVGLPPTPPPTPQPILRLTAVVTYPPARTDPPPPARAPPRPPSTAPPIA